MWQSGGHSFSKCVWSSCAISFSMCFLIFFLCLFNGKELPGIYPAPRLLEKMEINNNKIQPNVLMKLQIQIIGQYPPPAHTSRLAWKWHLCPCAEAVCLFPCRSSRSALGASTCLDLSRIIFPSFIFGRNSLALESAVKLYHYAVGTIFSRNDARKYPFVICGALAGSSPVAPSLAVHVSPVLPKHAKAVPIYSNSVKNALHWLLLCNCCPCGLYRRI